MFMYDKKKMPRIRNEINKMLHPPLSSFSAPYYNVDYHESSSSSARISPVLLLIIVIFAVIFFLAGLLHLLVRFLIKIPSFSPIYDQSNRYTGGNSDSHGRLQRQLQQLFRLHDSGLDQSIIDELPVFHYKDVIVVGLNEPFDCAVCLCEFLEHDKLRLLPLCGHAFHIDCIDTWLLSNSTCPLCRATLSAGSFGNNNPMFQFEYLRAMSNVSGSSHRPASAAAADDETAEDLGGKRVFSVRLGKFRSLNIDGGSRGAGRILQGEINNSCNLDATARRCYSMGAYQYVVGNSLQVLALSEGDQKKLMEGGERDESCSSISAADVEEDKTIRRSKGESFSVSKIWLWSKKSKFSGHGNVSVSLNQI